MVSIACVLLAGCASAAEHASVSECEGATNNFLLNPSAKTTARLADVGDDGCWGEVAAANEKLNSLNEAVATGNPWAARYLLNHMHTLDGGALEDALISLGKFSDESPQLFLEFAREGRLSKRAMEDALTMLPLELGDDLQAQLDFIRKRKRALSGVNTRRLGSQKKDALMAIDAFELEIIRAMRPS